MSAPSAEPGGAVVHASEAVYRIGQAAALAGGPDRAELLSIRDRLRAVMARMAEAAEADPGS